MRASRLLFALFFEFVACSSSSGSGLNSSEDVINLSSSDRAALCDWWASQYGGYGGSVSCGGGPLVTSLKGPTDQPSCVAGLPKASTASQCTATVQNYQNCVQSIVKQGCTNTMPIFDCNAIKSSLCVVADAGAD